MMNTEKAGIALSVLVFAGGILAVLPGMNIAPGYSDFITGNITWYAGSKVQDLVVWPLVILIVAAGFMALSRLAADIRERHGAGASSQFCSQLVLWSAPFYMTAAAAASGRAFENEAAWFAAIAIVFVSLVSFFWKSAPRVPDFEFAGGVFLAIALISPLPVGLAVLASRLPLGWAVSLPDFVTAGQAILLLGSVGAAVLVFRHEHIVRRHFAKILLVAQCSLLLFYFTIYPVRLVQPSGKLSEYVTTAELRILIAALILLGLADVARRYRAWSRSGDWKRLFSPFAVFALLVAFRAGLTVVPHISPDDYHFGESLLGWWSYRLGAVPYVDYIPPHGLIEDDLSAMLSSVFYDGKAASVAEAGRSAFVILGLVAFLSVYYFSGSMVLAFLAILLLGGRLLWLFLVPFICLWLSIRLRQNPGNWLSAWLLAVPLIILGLPAQGLILVAAFSPLAALMLWKQFRAGDRRSWMRIALAAAVVCLALWLTPLTPMLAGAIGYVRENGPINQIAYGLPWNLGWAGGHREYFLEFTRMSWVVVAIACVWVASQYRKGFRSPASHFYPAIIFLLICMLLVPYAMGRIDPQVMSRPGFASIFGWTVLFPLLVWRVVNARALVIMTVAIMGSLLGFSDVSVGKLIAAARPGIHTGVPMRDGADGGLANIGAGLVDDTQWDRLTRLNALLKARLAPGETYLDLTSRNAHYFYMDRKPPMAVTAPYNLVSLAQQKRAVEALADPPKLALLQADNIVHDGGGLALRSPVLYRFVIENYVPKSENGFIVGYRKQKTGDAQAENEEDAALFQRAFGVPDLKKIPIAWGRSEETLAARMDLVANLDGITPQAHDLSLKDGRYEVAGGDPLLVFDVSGLGLSGAGAGLLKFEFVCSGQTAEPRLQMFWWGDGRTFPSEESSFRLTAETGTLIVPLDVSPWWLTLKEVKGIRIDLDNPSACAAISIRKPAMYQRKAFAELNGAQQ